VSRQPPLTVEDPEDINDAIILRRQQTSTAGFRLKCLGGQHADSRDQQRDAYLRQQGWTILRFWNDDVLQKRTGVLQTIAAALTGYNPPTLTPRAPSVRHEGAKHQWKKDPSSELSIELVAGERLARETGRDEASRQRPPWAVEQSSGP
jgi:Protein of unknown function (DUF559)